MSEKELAREIKRLEKQMLEFARNLEFEKAAQARGHTIVFTTHHPQHGLFLADRALMMHAGDEVRYGQASAMMTDGELARLYGVPFARHTPGLGRPDVVSPIFGAAALP